MEPLAACAWIVAHLLGRAAAACMPSLASNPSLNTPEHEIKLELLQATDKNDELVLKGMLFIRCVEHLQVKNYFSPIPAIDQSFCTHGCSVRRWSRAARQ